MNRVATDAWQTFCSDPTDANFNAFYETTRALVYTLCFRVLRNEDDALDAFQSSFCRLLAWARGLARKEIAP